MEEYLVGQLVRVFIENIAPEGGAVEDATTVALLVRKGDGTLDTYAIGDLTHDAVGSYYLDLAPAPGEEGVWAWRFDTTDPVVAKEGVFVVAPSALLDGDLAWPQTGPCHSWTDRDEIERLPMDLAGIDDGLVERCVEAASDVMFQLAGRRWPGLCDRTVRVGGCDEPLLPLPLGGTVAWRPYAWHANGLCGGARTVELPGPIHKVHEVRIDGVVLSSSAYAVREGLLVRLDGGTWPCLGHVWDDPPAMEVDYSFGDAPPAMGRLAATVLATELIRSRPGGDGCRLSPRVQSIVREGVTMDFALPGLAENLANGQTGIPEVDLFVMAHNPQKLQRRPRFVGLH